VATLDNQGAKQIASNPKSMVLIWIVPSVEIRPETGER